jgi:hypothetical protein
MRWRFINLDEGNPRLPIEAAPFRNTAVPLRTHA